MSSSQPSTRPALFRIETDRLLIRSWEPEDEPAFREMVADPEMMRYISSGTPWSEERIAEFFTRQRRHLTTHGICLDALVLRATCRVIGISGLQPMRVGDDVEIGWWVAKDLWGQGLGTEAGAGALRYAWDVLGLRRVVAVAYPENRPSTRIMEKIGMHFERLAPSPELGLSLPSVDLVVYAIER